MNQVDEAVYTKWNRMYEKRRIFVNKMFRDERNPQGTTAGQKTEWSKKKNRRPTALRRTRERDAAHEGDSSSRCCIPSPCSISISFMSSLHDRCHWWHRAYINIACVRTWLLLGEILNYASDRQDKWDRKAGRVPSALSFISRNELGSFWSYRRTRVNVCTWVTARRLHESSRNVNWI